MIYRVNHSFFFLIRYIILLLLKFRLVKVQLPGAAHAHDGLKADLAREVAVQNPPQLLRLPRARRVEQRDVVHCTTAEFTHTTCHKGSYKEMEV